MADSLDDFFAKKDKKRGKDKSKTVLTAEALVKELEKGSKQVEYTARKDIKTSAAIELLDTDDADWKDFEDIEKRDYTGLKIKEISLQDQNDEDFRRLHADQIEGREESTVWKTKDGPSKDDVQSEVIKVDVAPAAAPPAAAAPTVVTPVTAAAPNPEFKPDTDENLSKSGSSAEAKTDESETSDKSSATIATSITPATATKKVYVPPSQRNLPSSLEPSKLPKRSFLNRMDAPPNLDNDNDFPGLG